MQYKKKVRSRSVLVSIFKRTQKYLNKEVRIFLILFIILSNYIFNINNRLRCSGLFSLVFVSKYFFSTQTPRKADRYIHR